MGGDGTKTTWHVGYFPKTLICVNTEKAYKINMPSHSIYRDYIFWLPVGFVKKVIPNSEEYYYFFLPEHFEVELHLEGSDYKVTDRKEVKASYLKEVFATLTSEIKKELGIEDKEALELINISQIKNLFLDSSIEIAQIARHSGLSRQTVNKIRQESPQQELIDDLVSIIHVFSCRIYGLRKYKKDIRLDESLQDGNLSHQTTKTVDSSDIW